MQQKRYIEEACYINRIVRGGKRKSGYLIESEKLTELNTARLKFPR
jgi:hypothetical protein